MRCYNCQGEGHIARNCPSKGWSPKGFGKGGKAWEPPKGKGKGGFYGGGKGKGGVYGGEKGQKGGSGKGPRYGKCYICDGDHFMAQCPNNKGGKGMGKQGLMSMEESWDAWSDPSNQESYVGQVKVLASVTEIKADKNKERSATKKATAS